MTTYLLNDSIKKIRNKNKTKIARLKSLSVLKAAQKLFVTTDNHLHTFLFKVTNFTFKMTLLKIRHQLESFTMSKTDPHLLRQKVGQIFSVIKTNTFDDIKKIDHFDVLIHFLSSRQQVFVMITEIF